jgi:hypothetical protein
MQSAMVPMPVTIEQVAVVVRNMSRKDRQRLLELVPELRETPNMLLSMQSTKDQTPVEQLRREILAALDGQLLASDEPFLDNLTVGDYLDLPDAERAHLWDRWTADADLSWEEVDVRPDALLAR